MVFFFRRAVSPKTAGRVVVFGATTAMGQSLSLLLKLCPHVGDVHCCGPSTRSKCGSGTMPLRGLVSDLSHIDTSATVKAFDDLYGWEKALQGAQLVLFCSGTAADFPRAQRDFVLAESAPELMLAMEVVARAAPKAIIGVVSNPVNALVPLAKEVLMRYGVFDPRKLFGVTTLDVIRTRTLVAQELQMNPYDVNVSVVGGRGGLTACPLVAQTGLRLPHERIVAVCNRLQSYGAYSSDDDGDSCHVPEYRASCLNGVSSLDLSLAYAVTEWSVSILKALRGDRGIIECAYVESTVRKEVPFFSSRVEIGAEGVTRLLPLDALTSYEAELVESAVPLISEDIEAGLRFAAEKKGTALCG